MYVRLPEPFFIVWITNEIHLNCRTSFLQISREMVILTRTFINRQEVEKNFLDTSIYSADKKKSIQLKLSRVRVITLSNKDLKTMYKEIHQKIVAYLFEMNEDELRSLNKFTNGKYGVDYKNEVNAVYREKEMLKLPLITDHWKCYLVIDIDDITRIRAIMNGSALFDTDFMSGHNQIYRNLLVRRLISDKSSVISIDESESDTEDNGEEIDNENLFDEDELQAKQLEDTKKKFKARYRGRYIIPIPLNIYVYARN